MNKLYFIIILSLLSISRLIKSASLTDEERAIKKQHVLILNRSDKDLSIRTCYYNRTHEKHIKDYDFIPTINAGVLGTKYKLHKLETSGIRPVRRKPTGQKILDLKPSDKNAKEHNAKMAQYGLTYLIVPEEGDYALCYYGFFVQGTKLGELYPDRTFITFNELTGKAELSDAVILESGGRLTLINHDHKNYQLVPINFKDLTTKKLIT